MRKEFKVPMTKTRSLSRFVKHIDRLITESELIQREIADRLGYEKANIITMFKQGTTRVPLDKVPQLADALDVDRVDLINVWLKDYEPEMLEVVQQNLGVVLSRSERTWVLNLRETFDGVLPAWDERSEEALERLIR